MFFKKECEELREEITSREKEHIMLENKHEELKMKIKVFEEATKYSFDDWIKDLAKIEHEYHSKLTDLNVKEARLNEKESFLDRKLLLIEGRYDEVVEILKGELKTKDDMIESLTDVLKTKDTFIVIDKSSEEIKPKK